MGASVDDPKWALLSFPAFRQPGGRDCLFSLFFLSHVLRPLMAGVFGEREERERENVCLSKQEKKRIKIGKMQAAPAAEWLCLHTHTHVFVFPFHFLAQKRKERGPHFSATVERANANCRRLNNPRFSIVLMLFRALRWLRPSAFWEVHFLGKHCRLTNKCMCHSLDGCFAVVTVNILSIQKQ